MKSLLLVFAFGLFVTPACLVRTPDGAEVRPAAVVVVGKRCHPSRVWDGERCVKRGRSHHGHHHHHHHYHAE